MRTHILGAAIVGFAALAASAPAPQNAADTCSAIPTTVFVTLPGVSTIVTIHEAPVTTVYVTASPSTTVVQVSAAPTTTLTRVYYSTITTTEYTDISTVYASSAAAGASSSVNGDATSLVVYDTTITETATETATETVYVQPTSFASSVSSSAGPLSFMVNNGTTYWAGGKAPASTGSYVVVTAAVTVVPLLTVPTSQESISTSTTTALSTIYETHELTLTKTISTVSDLFSTVSKPSFTGMAHGGWNQSSTGFAYATGTAPSRILTTLSSSQAFIYTEEPSYNLHPSRTTRISLTASAAMSGFDALTTPTVMASSTSSANGAWTVSMVGSQNASWVGAAIANATATATGWTSTVSCTESSTHSSITNSAFPSVSKVSSGYFWPPLVNTSSAVFLSSAQTAAGVAISSAPSSFLTAPTFAASSSNSGVPTASKVSNSTISTSRFFSSTTTPVLFANGPSTSVGSTTSSALGVATSGSLSNMTGTMSSISPSSKTTSAMMYANGPSISVSSSASATPTYCGERGDFTLTFDDIPPLSVSNNTDPNTVQPEPVFSPYHQFDFSDGFVVVPPPTDPYLPSSKPLLTEFIPNFNSSDPQAVPNTQAYGYSGDIANGDHGFTGCFGFDFYGASFGCDSKGPDCVFSFTGFRYNATAQQLNQVSQKTTAISACPALQDCSLVPITFTNEFTDLDKIRINVTVAGAPKIWWMDNLNLGWYNNTCAMGLCRVNTHVH